MNATQTNGNTALARVQHGPGAEAIEKAIVEGDLAQLTPQQRVAYYKAVCESVGLNPLTKPFRYIRLNGALVLYATRDATDQIRSLRNVSLDLLEARIEDGVYIQKARATMPNGRTDASTGAVAIEGLKGENRANAIMKAETKAKRRVTLSICGLGMIDESELDAIPHVQRVEHDPETGEIRGELPPARPASVPPPANDAGPGAAAAEARKRDQEALYNTYWDAIIAAKDLDALKAAWAQVQKEKKRGVLTLDHVANLDALKNQQKKKLESAPLPHLDPASLEVGDDPAGLGPGKARVQETSSGKTTFDASWGADREPGDDA